MLKLTGGAPFKPLNLWRHLVTVDGNMDIPEKKVKLRFVWEIDNWPKSKKKKKKKFQIPMKEGNQAVFEFQKCLSFCWPLEILLFGPIVCAWISTKKTPDDATISSLTLSTTRHKIYGCLISLSANPLLDYSPAFNHSRTNQPTIQPSKYNNTINLETQQWHQGNPPTTGHWCGVGGYLAMGIQLKLLDFVIFLV